MSKKTEVLKDLVGTGGKRASDSKVVSSQAKNIKDFEAILNGTAKNN